MGERATDAAGEFRAARVRHALKRLRGVLGSRYAWIGDPDADAGRATELAGVLARVVPSCDERPAPTLTVVGRPDAVPLLSGTLTGVLLAHAVPVADDAPRVLAEVGRLLQPGGFVLLLERFALGERSPAARGFDDVLGLLRAAGLEPGRRLVCYATPSRAAGWAAHLPRWLWGAAAALERVAWRLRLTRPGEVTAVVAARKAGGLDVDYPDARRMVGGMFVPPRWLERRGRRD